MFKIKITKNGPYIILGLKKLVLADYAPNANRVLDYQEKQQFEVQEEYHLCRCGQSKKAPFCDGSHATISFDGTEVADRAAYITRSDVFEGPEMSTLDDERCAFARFCHREKGDVWTLTAQSQDPEKKREAIEGGSNCPAGRLTPIVNNEVIEQAFEDSIVVAEDVLKKVSASLNVRGEFTLESANGSIYEMHNRMALCRCGQSRNKPFCDASHVNTQYNDQIKPL